MSNNYPPCVIVGTGAMANLFASRLTEVGVPITMLGTWQEGLRILNQNGVTVVDIENGEKKYPVRATHDPSNCRGAGFALVLVKSWQTWRAARQLADCLASDGVALSLQNGMGNREALTDVLGSRRVAVGGTTISSNLVGPGRIYSAGEKVISVSAHSRLSPLVDILRKGGFLVENSPDPNVLLWGKLVITAALHPVTALLGITNGKLMELSTARALMAVAARETASVAVARGISLPYPDPVVAAEAIAKRAATIRSPMLQDVDRGAPTEIDALSGAIVRAGERLGVSTIINRTLWQLVKAKVGASESKRD